MTAPPAPMPPGSRALLGWWRDLASLEPSRLWLARLLLHRVEAPVEIGAVRPLDPLRRAALAALALGEVAPLDALHLDPPLAARVLDELARDGLLGPDGRSVTPAGRAALEEGVDRSGTCARRVFWFADHTALGRPPHYLPLHRPHPVPLAAPQDWHFDPAVLDECVRRPADWKERFGFPPEVETVCRPTGGEAGWQRVTLDRPEMLPLVLAEVNRNGTSSLVGLPVREDGWALAPSAPVLTLGAGWAEALPELADEPAEAWRQAWLAWCRPRNVPLPEAEACRLERSGHLLRVQAPARLIERLRAARSDAVKGEAWLTAGGPRVWAIAQVDLAPLAGAD